MVITISGSMKYRDEMIKLQEELTLKYGWTILLPSIINKNKEEITKEENKRLLESHYRKIDISDKVIIFDKDGYIGNNTKKEISYCSKKGKPILWFSTLEDYNDLKR